LWHSHQIADWPPFHPFKTYILISSKLGILTNRQSQVRVRQRPNPTIDIGNIDDSVALILCDSESHDMPIVYCSERFESLTGYSSPEIIGRNCRFLQNPPTNKLVKLAASQEQEIRKTNGIARMVLRDKLPKDEEAQVKLVNFKKDGSVFVNILTVIPILWDDTKEKHGKKKKYVVGFQVDAQRGLLR
jgi:PAS domain S-box-containing protein